MRPDRSDQPKLVSLAARLGVCLVVWAVILPGPASSAPRDEPTRVLMLHSFGQDLPPWSEYALSIKAELKRQSPWPLELAHPNRYSAVGELTTSVAQQLNQPLASCSKAPRRILMKSGKFSLTLDATSSAPAK